MISKPVTGLLFFSFEQPDGMSYSFVPPSRAPDVSPFFKFRFRHDTLGGLREPNHVLACPLALYFYLRCGFSSGRVLQRQV